MNKSEGYTRLRSWTTLAIQQPPCSCLSLRELFTICHVDTTSRTFRSRSALAAKIRCGRTTARASFNDWSALCPGATKQHRPDISDRLRCAVNQPLRCIGLPQRLGPCYCNRCGTHHSRRWHPVPIGHKTSCCPGGGVGCGGHSFGRSLLCSRARLTCANSLTISRAPAERARKRLSECSKQRQDGLKRTVTVNVRLLASIQGRRPSRDGRIEPLADASAVLSATDFSQSKIAQALPRWAPA
jgi:hypothetical protein